MPKIMFYRPSLRLLDESARIARGYSVAAGETAEACSPGLKCHWISTSAGRLSLENGRNGRRKCLEAIPFEALRLKTGRKRPNFHQARGFLHWNARKSRGVLILTGISVLRKIGGGSPLVNRMMSDET